MAVWRSKKTIPIVGKRQKAHVHVQARLATSCRQTLPKIGIVFSLLQSNLLIFKLSHYPATLYRADFD
jgi:hypothetical protein